MRGIDPRASHMLSERSTTWATPPYLNKEYLKLYFWITDIMNQIEMTLNWWNLIKNADIYK